MRILPLLCTMLTILLGLAHQESSAQTTITFESLPIPSSGYFNGDTSGTSPYRDNFSTTDAIGNETLQLWSLDGAEFFNSFTPDSGFGASWRGFSWSNVTDPLTPGFGNQYAAYPGGGSDGAGGFNPNENYAIAFAGFSDDLWFNLPSDSMLESIELTNTTYTALSMRDGDSFAKQFGGSTGDDPDYFGVTFTGFTGVNKMGTAIGSVDFDLADFRFANQVDDYILDAWTRLDLSSLSSARSVSLSFTTTDVGQFGPNTPFYVAVDNLTFAATSVPEPVGLAGFILAAIGFLLPRQRASRRC